MVTCFGWAGVRKSWTIRVLIPMSTSRLIQNRQLRKESTIDSGLRGGGRLAWPCAGGCSGGALLAMVKLLKTQYAPRLWPIQRRSLRSVKLCARIPPASLRQQRAYRGEPHGARTPAVHGQHSSSRDGFYGAPDVGRQRMTTRAQVDQLQAHRPNPGQHDLVGRVVRPQRHAVAVDVDRSWPGAEIDQGRQRLEAELDAVSLRVASDSRNVLEAQRPVGDDGRLRLHQKCAAPRLAGGTERMHPQAIHRVGVHDHEAGRTVE